MDDNSKIRHSTGGINDGHPQPPGEKLPQGRHKASAPEGSTGTGKAGGEGGHQGAGYGEEGGEKAREKGEGKGGRKVIQAEFRQLFGVGV